MPAPIEDRVKDLERRLHTLEDAYDNLPRGMGVSAADPAPDEIAKPTKDKPPK